MNEYVYAYEYAYDVYEYAYESVDGGVSVGSWTPCIQYQLDSWPQHSYVEHGKIPWNDMFYEWTRVLHTLAQKGM